MSPVFQALLAVIRTVARSRLSLQLEVVALRHQLSVYQRSVPSWAQWWNFRRSTASIAIMSG